MVRNTLSDHLAKKKFQVVATDSQEEAMQAASELSFDAAIVDIVLPRVSGERASFQDNMRLTVARELRRLQPTLGIVFLSAYVDRGPEVVQMFMEGHDHIVYLAKGSRPAELMEALRKVMRDSPALEIGPGIARTRATVFDVVWKVLASEERMLIKRALEHLPKLSDAEQRVFETLGVSLSRHGVADRLGVSIKAVDYHINSIYDKLLLHELPAGYSPSALLVKVYLMSKVQQL
jgi:DNA-binding NarL/FixJ family response regulator